MESMTKKRATAIVLSTRIYTLCKDQWTFDGAGGPEATLDIYLQGIESDEPSNPDDTKADILYVLMAPEDEGGRPVRHVLAASREFKLVADPSETRSFGLSRECFEAFGVIGITDIRTFYYVDSPSRGLKSEMRCEKWAEIIEAASGNKENDDKENEAEPAAKKKAASAP